MPQVPKGRQRDGDRRFGRFDGVREPPSPRTTDLAQPRSSHMQRSVLPFVASLLSTALAAQQPQPAPPPAQDTSLAARLERAERLLEMLREQVSQQATARVEPRSGSHVELSGLGV